MYVCNGSFQTDGMQVHLRVCTDMQRLLSTDILQGRGPSHSQLSNVYCKSGNFYCRNIFVAAQGNKN